MPSFYSSYETLIYVRTIKIFKFMKKEERFRKIETAKLLIDQASKLLSSIVWEGQEGQADGEHFDTLQKSEHVAILGLFNDLKNAENNFTMYKKWFIDGDKSAKSEELSVQDALKTMTSICTTPIIQRKFPDLYESAKAISEQLPDIV